LVGPKGKGGSYHVADLEFLNALCRSAAMALHIRRDTSWAMESARDDATTKVAVALAHDLGKEVDWMTRLVRRLPDIATNRGLLERDVRLATDLSRNVSRGLRRFVREATDGRGEPETVLIDDLIDDAVRRVARVHGEDRITPMVDPALGDTRIHRDLERVIANLLDNAIHASPETESVRLFARRVNHGTEIVVEDQGVGFSEEQSPKLFRPGFTTRGDRGGLGVGLSACRDILRELGGCMELYSGPEGGTRARVLLPTS
jgi:signal transduction histidine kinase